MSSAQPRCLILDLEAQPADGDEPARILKIGALRPDTGATLEVGLGRDPAAALHQLESLTAGASFVLGHNLIEHDLPLLHALAPTAHVLSLPAVDTLHLSPLAFPQNPYHRLIKNYKLIHDSLNSPLADCRATLTLFGDQQAAFARLAATHPQELRSYHALLAPRSGAGLGNVFLALARQPAPSPAEVAGWLPALLAESDPTLQRTLKVCRTRLAALAAELAAGAATLHWPLAYTLAWLRVSGGNSVLAPWVRHQFPRVAQLIRELRDTPCGDPACDYCATTHDPRHELRRCFGFDDFRVDEQGRNMQHDVVLAGMQGQPVLTVLATGGGKSLCYQLPALNRYHRNGSLTIIISPLQALMKDQVDGLLARNVHCAASLNARLTLPERADVLEKIQMGDIGLLLVSPEQFRNRGFRNAIEHREIGAWIFDEAHCLSKWGNDFRPDYLYAARFIREFSAPRPPAPIGCFTATAKQDVLDDIRQHFREELDMEFVAFLGTPERSNLHFEVFPIMRGEKHDRVQQLLTDALADDGGAVVFTSSRGHSEQLAEFLATQNWACRHFHAGLRPNEKKDIQDAFLAGALRVIVATNAFGMGVDKPDVRIVVHADIPGSLENYLQEAGRAGRDQLAARCVLLYDPDDIERQFGLNERARLRQGDLQQILLKLRNEAKKRKNADALILTAGEILLDENVHTSFEADDRDAETKTVIALSWLERAGFLRREENHTRIFPARLRVKREEAEARLRDANLSSRKTEEYRAILNFLARAPADQSIDTDQLMQLTGQSSEEISASLRQLENLDILDNDSQITLYARVGVVSPSRERLRHCLQLEAALLRILREQAPDADLGGWQDLHLPTLTSALRAHCQRDDILPLHVLRLLRALAQDRDGERAQRSSLELREDTREHLKLRILNGYTWDQVERQGERRRHLAVHLLEYLLGTVSKGTASKDTLIETTFGALQNALVSDLSHGVALKPEQRTKAVEHLLLYLSRQEVLILNHGMTVMRRAMRIQLNPDRHGQRYLKQDFRRLDEHYRERRIQVHVMREYAEIALREMAAALRLVLDYFSQPRDRFLRHYFKGKDNILKLATSEDSWQAITGGLTPAQRAIVSADDDRNRLVLAGPGSGKTRVVVHRIAWLLRVRRIPATAIIALTFNRHAANEIRQRLFALVGADAIGLTYHAMAMRLTGTRFARGAMVSENELGGVLDRAADLLDGTLRIDGEDDLRDRLLQGYRYILVDEYQDIDARQYRLVSALARRHDEAGDGEAAGRLCLLAVGDDDQNIYNWRGGSNQYIERFRADYAAGIEYLVENFRSSAAIIDAANRLIAHNTARLKVEHPVHIDAARRGAPLGGRWQALDEARAGQVLNLRLPAADRASGNRQAQAALAEVQRLSGLDEHEDWNGCAVLARSHRYLWPVQAWCERAGMPYFLAADGQNTLPLTRQRAFTTFIDQLRERDTAPFDPAEAARLAHDSAVDAVWQTFFATAFAQLHGEYGHCQLAPATLIDWLYDYARELRQQPRPGLFIGTVHAAKGLEFRHVVVLDGDWRSGPSQIEDERRLYYVAMTRAEETLTLCEFAPANPFAATLRPGLREQVCELAHDPGLDTRYQTLGMADIDLSFAGRQPPDAPIHAAIRRLEAGDPLTLCADRERYALLDRDGVVVGRTSKNFRLEVEVEHCEVAAILTRYAEDSDPAYLGSLRCPHWELVVPRLQGQERSEA